MTQKLKVKVILYAGVCLACLAMFLWGYFCNRKGISTMALTGRLVGMLFGMLSTGIILVYGY